MPPARSSIGCPSASRRCRASARCRPLRSSRRSATLDTQFTLERGQSDGADAADGAHHRRDAQLLRDAARAASRRAHHEPDRSSRYAARRDRQQSVRGAVSRRHRSGRPAACDRQPGSAAAVDDDRRRRGRLSEQRRHAADPSGDLHPGAPADGVESALRAGAHRRLAGGAAARRARRPSSSLDPEQPVYSIQTLDEALATSSFQQRISTVLLSDLRRRRARARRDRHLRRDVVRGERAHAGDGRAPRRRRAAPRRDLARPRRRCCGCRRSAWRSASACVVAAGRALEGCSSACTPPIPRPSRR